MTLLKIQGFDHHYFILSNIAYIFCTTLLRYKVRRSVRRCWQVEIQPINSRPQWGPHWSVPIHTSEVSFVVIDRFPSTHTHPHPAGLGQRHCSCWLATQWGSHSKYLWIVLILVGGGEFTPPIHSTGVGFNICESPANQLGLEVNQQYCSVI